MGLTLTPTNAGLHDEFMAAQQELKRLQTRKNQAIKKNLPDVVEKTQRDIDRLMKAFITPGSVEPKSEDEQKEDAKPLPMSSPNEYAEDYLGKEWTTPGDFDFNFGQIPGADEAPTFARPDGLQAADQYTMTNDMTLDEPETNIRPNPVNVDDDPLGISTDMGQGPTKGWNDVGKSVGEIGNKAGQGIRSVGEGIGNWWDNVPDNNADLDAEFGSRNPFQLGLAGVDEGNTMGRHELTPEMFDDPEMSQWLMPGMTPGADPSEVSADPTAMPDPESVPPMEDPYSMPGDSVDPFAFPETEEAPAIVTDSSGIDQKAPDTTQTVSDLTQGDSSRGGSAWTPGVEHDVGRATPVEEDNKFLGGARKKFGSFFGHDTEEEMQRFGAGLTGFSAGLLTGGSDFGAAMGHGFAKGREQFVATKRSQRQASLDDYKMAQVDEKLDRDREKHNQWRRDTARKRALENVSDYFDPKISVDENGMPRVNEDYNPNSKPDTSTYEGALRFAQVRFPHLKNDPEALHSRAMDIYSKKRPTDDIFTQLGQLGIGQQ